MRITAASRETGFQHLPTYGVGKDRTRRFWKYLIDALTRQGLAAIEGEEYPYLRVTETGWETLRGAPFRALRIVETRARRNRAERDGASQDMDVDDTLFQLLRAERRRLAEAAQVPPYVVFHDRALREMAAGKPGQPRGHARHRRGRGKEAGAIRRRLPCRDRTVHF